MGDFDDEAQIAADELAAGLGVSLGNPGGEFDFLLWADQRILSDVRHVEFHRVIVG